MIYAGEGRGVVYALCEDCGMKLKFQKTLLRLQNGSAFLMEDVECFCGEKSREIRNLPILENRSSGREEKL